MTVFYLGGLGSAKLAAQLRPVAASWTLHPEVIPLRIHRGGSTCSRTVFLIQHKIAIMGLGCTWGDFAHSWYSYGRIWEVGPHFIISDLLLIISKIFYGRQLLMATLYDGLCWLQHTPDNFELDVNRFIDATWLLVIIFQTRITHVPIILSTNLQTRLMDAYGVDRCIKRNHISSKST